MKRFTPFVISFLFIFAAFTACEKISTPVEEAQNNQTRLGKTGGGTTIQDGILKYQSGHHLAGKLLKTGFDVFGYNYQSMMFKGSYANAYLGGEGFPPYTGDDAAYIAANPNVVNKWYWPYRSTQLEMKWNEAWLSNTDKDGDGKLDRHFGFGSYIGSGAWITNHMADTYPVDNKLCRWTDFVKIVAVPGDAVLRAGLWYNAAGTQIGTTIWGEFALIQEIYNDECAGFNGKLNLSPAGPGFGKY